MNGYNSYTPEKEMSNEKKWSLWKGFQVIVGAVIIICSIYFNKFYILAIIPQIICFGISFYLYKKKKEIWGYIGEHVGSSIYIFAVTGLSIWLITIYA